MSGPVSSSTAPGSTNAPPSPQVVAAGSTVSEPCPNATADLFASLAHDLRSPLGVVSETIAELNADFADQLTDEHRVLIGLAERSLRKLTRIAESLSLMVALDSGSLELRSGRADFLEIVRRAIDTATSVEPRREVSVARELPDAAFPIEADVDRLARAISEVVINAIRYARQSVRVCVDLSDDEVRVSVEDDGQGLAPGPRSTLFRRLAPRTTRSGLGIGLSLAHDVVVAHGGAIALGDSTLPPRAGVAGARFVLSFPRPKPH